MERPARKEYGRLQLVLMEQCEGSFTEVTPQEVRSQLNALIPSTPHTHERFIEDLVQTLVLMGSLCQPERRVDSQLRVIHPISGLNARQRRTCYAEQHSPAGQ
jgi:hypothetical protein